MLLELASCSLIYLDTRPKFVIATSYSLFVVVLGVTSEVLKSVRLP